MYDDISIYNKSYPYPEVHKKEVQNQTERMSMSSTIRPSYSPWSSSIWVAPRKLYSSGKRKWRMVIGNTVN